MSVVVAIKDKKTNEIFMACDNRSTSGNIRYYSASNAGYKISPIHGSEGCLLGACGSCGTLQIVKHTYHLLDDEKDPNYRDFTLTFIPKLLKILNDEYSIYKRNCFRYYKNEDSFIVATESRLFDIKLSDGVRLCSDYASRGSGSNSANTAYNYLKDSDMSKEDIAIECVKNSIMSNTGVGWPIIVTSNRRNYYRIINEDGSESKKMFE